MHICVHVHLCVHAWVCMCVHVCAYVCMCMLWISWKEEDQDQDAGSGLEDSGEKAGLLEDLALSCSLARCASWARTGLLSCALVLASKQDHLCICDFTQHVGRALSYVLPGGIGPVVLGPGPKPVLEPQEPRLGCRF